MKNAINTAFLDVSGSGDIRTIASIHARLLDAMKSSDSIVIDLDAVETPDITLVQLVEAGRRFSAANGKSLALKNAAAGELRSVLARGGFLATEERRAFWLKDREAGR